MVLQLNSRALEGNGLQADNADPDIQLLSKYCLGEEGERKDSLSRKRRMQSMFFSYIHLNYLTYFLDSGAH